MSDPLHRITMRQLAAEAGVNQSTVSRALRNDARISEAVRHRINGIARKRAYRPDPVLSALMTYRTARRIPNENSKIAVIRFCESGARADKVLEREFTGIRERAKEQGYSTELFLCSPAAAEMKRLSRILFSRGIRGLLIGPLAEHLQLLDMTPFEWARFSSVALGYSMRSPRLHYVAQDHDRRIEMVYRHLQQLGYRKIGFVNRRSVEHRNRHLFVGGYLKCLYLDGRSTDKSPPLLYEDWTDLNPLPWLKRFRFDAVMAAVPGEFIAALKPPGIKVPTDLGVAGVAIDPDNRLQRPISGATEDLAAMGRTAVDLLHRLLCDADRGIPKHCQAILLEGGWNPGRTLKTVKRK